MIEFKRMIKKEDVNYVELFKTCDEKTRIYYMYNILLNEHYSDGFADVVNQYNEYAGIFKPEEVAKEMNISINCFRMLLSYDKVMRYDDAVFYYVNLIEGHIHNDDMFIFDYKFKAEVKSDFILSIIRAILEAIGYKVWIGFIDILDSEKYDLHGKIPTYIAANPDKKGDEVLKNLAIIEKSRGRF